MTSNELLTKFNDYLVRLPYERKPTSLYEPIKYVLSLGGKRIRPMLMLLAYNMYKDDPETIFPSACALETYHNYTLLHDDLMDNAMMRRGHATVHTKWNANTAILSGDTMLVLACRRMAQCAPGKQEEVLGLFLETALEIGEGQQYDMEFENRTDVSEEEYMEMIRLKTGVLLACALKIGAVLADAPDEDAVNLYGFGEKIGLAFQLQDDYLDVYGNPDVFGKNIGGDILCNKKTYMLINAFARADEEQREELFRWIDATGKCDPDEKVKAVTRLYDAIGIDRLVEEKINSCFEEGCRYLAAVQVDDSRKKELADYTALMMKRKR